MDWLKELALLAGVLSGSIFITKRQFNKLSEEIDKIKKRTEGPTEDHVAPLSICLAERARMKEDIKNNSALLQHATNQIFAQMGIIGNNIAILQTDIQWIRQKLFSEMKSNDS